MEAQIDTKMEQAEEMMREVQAPEMFRILHALTAGGPTHGSLPVIRVNSCAFVVKTNAGRTPPRALRRWCCLPRAQWRCSYPVEDWQ